MVGCLPGEIDRAISVNDVLIRLPEERWEHIIDSHFDLKNYREDILDVIENPDAVYRGRSGSLIAIRSLGRRGFLAIFYRETSQQDGFVITARFIDNRPGGEKVWPKQ
ncbi:hypothetical protein KJ693_12540 [bacterium]|nr:hypothetical protein [bacterium]